VVGSDVKPAYCAINRKAGGCTYPSHCGACPFYTRAIGEAYTFMCPRCLLSVAYEDARPYYDSGECGRCRQVGVRVLTAVFQDT
jgi:hypothetical protein